MKAGWRVVPLREVTAVGAGNPAPQDKADFDGGSLPFIRTSDVGKIRFGEISASVDLVNEKCATKLRLVPKGTVLFPKSGASTFLNHRVITTVDAYVSSHLATITAKPNHLDSRFLLYALSRVRTQELLPENSYPSLNLSLLGSAKIPLPPLDEQKRIVAVLDEAFEGLSRARANAEANLADARELFERRLAAFFGESRAGWRSCKLSEVTKKVGSGATPKGGAGSYKTEGISLIRSLNVHDRQFRSKDLAFLDDAQAQKLSNVAVEADDVLLNITGASIARCCMAPKDYLPARVNQHVSIIRCDKRSLRPEYLMFLLTSEPYKSFLLRTGEDNGSTRQALTKGLILDLVVSFPIDLQEQDDAVSELKAAEGESKDLSHSYSAKVIELDSLRRSLLQKAFSGELT